MAEVMQPPNNAGDDLNLAISDQDTVGHLHGTDDLSTLLSDATWDFHTIDQTFRNGGESAYHTSSSPDGVNHAETPRGQTSDMEKGPAHSTNEKANVAVEKPQRIEGFDEEDYELPKRELRPQQREKRKFATTWIDNDETGDFDPEEEERKARQKRAKLRAANIQRRHRDKASASSDDEVSDQPGDELTNEALEPSKLEVRLVFKSEAGGAALTELLSTLAAQGQSEKAGYKLRRRSKLAATHPSSTQDLTGGLSTDIDLTAKPFARGCWGCTTTGACSLLHDERQWPCQTCYEDDLDCELIVPPVRKRACEMCKRRRISCSYTYTRKHGACCEQCERVGQRCVAGPVKDFIPPRISYDRDWEADPLPKRKGTKQKELEDCLECVGGRRSCSYPTGSHGSPCEECIGRGLPCTITGNVPAESASPTEIATSNDAATSSRDKALGEQVTESSLTKPRSSARTTAERQQASPTSTMRKIYTSFPHPIAFDCDVDGKQVDCYFCTEPDLAKLGFGLMQPEVIDWSDGRGFIEVKDGHKTLNKIEPTTLCYECTLSRTAIVSCYRHKLAGLSPQDTAQSNHYCHVCSENATYGCVSSDGDKTGCGLKLCRSCAVVLSRDHSGYLGKMLGTLADRPEDPESRTLRADVEFLKEDGHIQRYLKSHDTE